MTVGSKVWVFPDGDLPPLQPADPSLRNPDTHGHESLVILNPGDQEVQPVLTVFFPDAEPWVVHLESIPARRVRCYRTDEPLGNEKAVVPAGQYALMVECQSPVVAQIGRMDIRQPNLAYYTTMGYPA
jgi:hypothetical protein